MLTGLRNRYSTLITASELLYGKFGIESLSRDDYGIDQDYFTLDDSSGGGTFTTELW